MDLKTYTHGDALLHRPARLESQSPPTLYIAVSRSLEMVDAVSHDRDALIRYLHDELLLSSDDYWIAEWTADDAID